MTERFAVDHLAVVARTLDKGAAFVRDRIGVEMAPGGTHPMMGTHNRLLRLGADEYLEVITMDPDATPPERPRWFGLDEFDEEPRLATWVVGTPDIHAALEVMATDCGRATPMTRGQLSWVISVADDGRLPMDGAHPSLIEWPVGPHPAGAMPDAGCALASLHVTHPDGAVIAARIGANLDDARVSISVGLPNLEAEIVTPHGVRNL